MPRNFRVLPTDVREVIDQYFHQGRAGEKGGPGQRKKA